MLEPLSILNKAFEFPDESLQKYSVTKVTQWTTGNKNKEQIKMTKSHLCHLTIGFKHLSMLIPHWGLKGVGWHNLHVYATKFISQSLSFGERKVFICFLCHLSDTSDCHLIRYCLFWERPLLALRARLIVKLSDIKFQCRLATSRPHEFQGRIC